MLSRLFISNYALIDELSVSFGGGLNIVTGETGAGKSIILGALSLILGARAENTTLRDPARKCIVEGYFDLSGRALESFFADHDLDYDPLSILRREITPAGKSRAFINDTPVNLTLMRELSLRLVDIHSQHQNLELHTRQFQLQVVDAVAHTSRELQVYQEGYHAFREASEKLTALREKAARSRADLDYLTFQYNQLGEARLSAGEQILLEEEQMRLTHAEEIRGALEWAGELLNGDHFPIVARLKEATQRIEKITPFLREAADLHERLRSAQIELNDLAYETGQLAGKTDIDPRRLTEINERLDLIYSLQQKHQLHSVEELLAYKDTLERQIGEITGYDEEIAALEIETARIENYRREAAALLTARRRKALPMIEEQVTAVLRQLAIPHARFIVELEASPGYTPSGADQVQFLFSANKEMPPAEISRIASGGEISRVMLALKSLVSGSRMLSTIIFDEIDAGISGETALKMGGILQDLSADLQVINITHLPQIAGKGNHHFVVFKEDTPSGTITSIRKLNGHERVEELARMVGGDNPSESARRAAEEMMK
ncbi:MAG: DNA repair protein RecN [Prolixibacteraceae bacterium]|nr:DNA repair protein RecN [Prolixibacteraceae bacterium]